jgi:hypothetical protein
MSRHVSIVVKKDVICKLISDVFFLIVEKIALSKFPSLHALLTNNGLMLGSGDYINHEFADAILELIADHYRALQKGRLLQSHFYSILGDGSTDRSMVENEIIYVKYLRGVTLTSSTHALGHVSWHWSIHPNEILCLATELLGLEPIDRQKSRDGLSFDSDAVKACYDTLCEKRIGEIYKGTTKRQHLVSASFDGASVIMGANNSVQSRYKEEVPAIIVIHAVAHALELSFADACLTVEYLDEGELVLRETYNFYNTSAKRLGQLQDVAAVVNQDLLKFCKMHGMRWMASKYRAVKALLNNWHVTVVTLQSDAFREVGLHFTSLTNAKQFLTNPPLKFPHLVQGDNGRQTTWVAKVIGVVDDGAEDAGAKVAGTAKLKLLYSNRQTDEMSVGTIVQHLATHASENKKEMLADVHSWQLHQKLHSFRLLVTYHFMLDVDAELKSISETFQRVDVTLCDVVDSIEQMQDSFLRMKTENGGMLQQCYNSYDEREETYLGLQLFDPENGKVEFDIDRQDLLDAYMLHANDRFGLFLGDPILKAARVFEQRRWPTHQDDFVKSWGCSEVKV